MGTRRTRARDTRPSGRRISAVDSEHQAGRTLLESADSTLSLCIQRIQVLRSVPTGAGRADNYTIPAALRAADCTGSQTGEKGGE